MAFYSEALQAKELFRMDTPDGGVGHAEFMIGESRIYLSEESEDWHAFAMPEGTMASCLFSIMTPDCDASMAKAESAGAKILSPAEDQFWGARSGVILDPFGYRWSFVQPTEELSEEEVRKRAEEM
jgi:PhnB protein